MGHCDIVIASQSDSPLLWRLNLPGNRSFERPELSTHTEHVLSPHLAA